MDTPKGGSAVVELQELLPCGICGRTFLPGPLEKHSKVCERNATKKRKVFDSLKQRVEGTDLAPFHQKSYLKRQDTSSIVTAPTVETKTIQSKWKEKHLELVNAIRAAKGAPVQSTPVKKTSALVMSSPNERCPSCDRQFGPKAFDRHVEWCKERKSRIQKSPANVLMAKERLEARTKYKVPPLIKSRRTLTREKYSPSMSRTESVTSIKSTSSTSLERSPSVRKPKSVASLKKERTIDKDLLHNSKSEKFMETTHAQKLNLKDNHRKVSITDSVKSSSHQMKHPKSKVNSVDVNNDVEGMTVSKLVVTVNETPRKLVTWKETVMKSQQMQICNVVKHESRPKNKKQQQQQHTSVVVTAKTSEPSLSKPPFYNKDITVKPQINSELHYVDIKGPGSPAKDYNIEEVEKNIACILKNDPLLQKMKIPMYKDDVDVDVDVGDDLDDCSCHNFELNTSKHGAELIEESWKILNPKKACSKITEINFFGPKPHLQNQKSVLDKYKVDESEFIDTYNSLSKKILGTNNLTSKEEPEIYPGDPCCSYSHEKLKNHPIKMILKTGGKEAKTSFKKLAEEARREIKKPAHNNHICSGKNSNSLCEDCRREFISCGIELKSKEAKEKEDDDEEENVVDIGLHCSEKEIGETILPPPNEFLEGWRDEEDNEENQTKNTQSEEVKEAKSTIQFFKANEEHLFIDVENENETNNEKKKFDFNIAKEIKKKKNDEFGLKSAKSDDLKDIEFVRKSDDSLNNASEVGSSAIQFCHKQSSFPKKLINTKDKVFEYEDADLTVKAFEFANNNSNDSLNNEPSEVEFSSNQRHEFCEKLNTKDKVFEYEDAHIRNTSKDSLNNVSEVGFSSNQRHEFCEKLNTKDKVFEYAHADIRNTSKDSLNNVSEVGFSSTQRQEFNKQGSCKNLNNKGKVFEFEDTDSKVFEFGKATSEAGSIQNQFNIEFDNEIFNNLAGKIVKSHKSNVEIKEVKHNSDFVINNSLSEEVCNAFKSKSFSTAFNNGEEVTKNQIFELEASTFSEETLTNVCVKDEEQNIANLTLKNENSKNCDKKDVEEENLERHFSPSKLITLNKKIKAKIEDSKFTNKNFNINKFNRSRSSSSNKKMNKKSKMQKSNVIFLNKNCGDASCDLDSLDGETSNPYNEVLSVARMQIRLRKCCSDVALFITPRCPESCNFTSYTEIDLTKVKIDQKMNESSFDVNILKTSTPKNSVTSCSTDYIPRKRRKLNISSSEQQSYNFNESVFACGDAKTVGGVECFNLRNVKSVPVFKFGSGYEKEPLKSASSSELAFIDSTESVDSLTINNIKSFTTDKLILNSNIEVIKNRRKEVNKGFLSPLRVEEDHYERYFYSQEAEQEEEQQKPINLYKEQEAVLDNMENELDEFQLEYVGSALNVIAGEKENEILRQIKSASCVPTVLNYPETEIKLSSVRLNTPNSQRSSRSRPRSASIKSKKSTPILSPKLENVLTSIYSINDLKSTMGMNAKTKDSTCSIINISKHDVKKLVSLDPDCLPKILEKRKSKYNNKKEAFFVMENDCDADVKIGGRKNSSVAGFLPEISAASNNVKNTIKPRFKNITMSKKNGNNNENSSGNNSNGMERGDTLECLNGDTAAASIDQNPFISAANRQIKELFGDDVKPIATTATLEPLERTIRPNTTNNTPIKNKLHTNKKSIKSADKLSKLSSSTTTHNKISPHKNINIKNKRASVIDPPTNFRDDEHLNDSFEMLENIINDNCGDGKTFNEDDLINLINIANDKRSSVNSENGNLSLSALLNGRKYSDDMSTIDPRLINENDNLSIPEHFKADDSSPIDLYDSTYTNHIDHYSIEYDKKISSFEKSTSTPKSKNKSNKRELMKHSVSVSLLEDVENVTDELCDNFMASFNEIGKFAKSISKSFESGSTPSSKGVSKLPRKDTQKVSNSNSNSNSLTNSSIGYASSSERKKNSLKRSISLLDPVVNPRMLKSKEDIENYFDEYEKGPKKNNTTSNNNNRKVENEKPPVLKPEELFSVDDDMYEEYKKYEQMYLQEKEARLKKEGKKGNEAVTGSEDDDHLTVKISGDSAYGSLNRKTQPKVRARATKLAPLDNKKASSFARGESPSSSGSETSPPAFLHSPSSATDNNHKMSKFCHECGNKYPVNSAKFCVECGVRRLVL